MTLAEKCKILDYLDNVGSIRRVAEKFNVPKSTVSDIKKNKTKIRRFVSESFNGSGMNNSTFIVMLFYETYFYVFRQQAGYTKRRTSRS